MRVAATSDLYETEASRLAEQRAQSAEVKRFAERMLRDHGKTTGELKGMLGQLQGVSAQQMPTRLDQQHETLMQQLQGAQGAEFDRAFARQQVQSHQAAVDLFRAYAQSGDDARLKQWASQTLPPPGSAAALTRHAGLTRSGAPERTGRGKLPGLPASGFRARSGGPP